MSAAQRSTAPRRPLRPGRSAGSALPATGWCDISVPVRDNMVHWPGDPTVRIRRIQNLDRGDTCNVALLSMSSHTGTHIDAPLHFVAGGTALDEMPFSATVGPARVIEIGNPTAIRAADLRGQRIRRGERLLFKTRNSARCWKNNAFVKDFVYVGLDAAEYLVQRRVRTVGVDYLSVGGFFHDNCETHLALLGAGIWVIEGLDLSRVRSGPYDLICLPLRIQSGDGGPARAIIRKGTR